MPPSATWRNACSPPRNGCSRRLPTAVPLPRCCVRGMLGLTGLRSGGVGFAALARMREDLVFDDAPARRDLGYAPRPFVPEAGMFLPR